MLCIELHLTQAIALRGIRKYHVQCAHAACTISSCQEMLFAFTRPRGTPEYRGDGAKLFFCQSHIDEAASLYSGYKTLEREHDIPVYYRWGEMWPLYESMVTQEGPTLAAQRIRRDAQALEESLHLRSRFSGIIKSSFHDPGHAYFFDTMTMKLGELKSIISTEEKKTWKVYLTKSSRRKLARERKALVDEYLYRYRPGQLC